MKFLKEICSHHSDGIAIQLYNQIDYKKTYKCAVIIFFFVLIFGNTLSGHACTTLAVKDGEAMMYGRSYDRGMRDALIFVNKINVNKQAQVFGNAAKWTSKYASITFNQYGQDFPLGGMNEKGLIIEVMILKPEMTYSPENKPEVNETQWVQYQLDTAASLGEVINNIPELAIAPTSVNLHYLVCDTKSCATIEFENNNPVIHKGDSLGVLVDGKFVPVRALSNSPYQSSIKALKKYSGFGGDKPEPGPAYLATKEGPRKLSIHRFINAAYQAKKLEAEAAAKPGSITVDKVFEALNWVAKPDKDTQFQIVYDQKNKAIHWKNVYSASQDKGVETTVPRKVSLDQITEYVTCEQMGEKVKLRNMQDPWDNRLQSQLKDVPYGEFVECEMKYNKELVEEADEKEILFREDNKAINFLKPIIQEDLLAQENNKWWATEFIEPLWYRYPEKFTKCGDEIKMDGIYNFYLELLRSPLSKMVDEKLKKWEKGYKYKGKQHLGQLDKDEPCKYQGDLEYKIKNIKHLESFEIETIAISSQGQDPTTGDVTLTGYLKDDVITAEFYGTLELNPPEITSCMKLHCAVPGNLKIHKPKKKHITIEATGKYTASIQNNDFCITKMDFDKVTLAWGEVQYFPGIWNSACDYKSLKKYVKRNINTMIELGTFTFNYYIMEAVKSKLNETFSNGPFKCQ
jgi:penicillin V acylase-like amidase (Ntn superfamily)